MRGVLTVASVIAVVAYPVAVYLGLRELGARGAGLALLAVVLLGLALRLSLARGQLREVAPVPLVTACLLGLTALLQESRFMLAVPVVVNAVLLLTFAGSLRSGQPLVERFARLQHPDLSAGEVRYCRSVTLVWSGFFVVNGAVAAGLALAGELFWWTVYTGLVSYALVGLLFAVEYLIRKWRFRRFGRGLHDRALAALFPPRHDP